MNTTYIPYGAYVLTGRTGLTGLTSGRGGKGRKGVRVVVLSLIAQVSASFPDNYAHAHVARASMRQAGCDTYGFAIPLLPEEKPCR